MADFKIDNRRLAAALDDRRYFELSTFYDEMSTSWQDRRLPMRHDPRNDDVEVYRVRQERNGGERRVSDAPWSDD